MGSSTSTLSFTYRARAADTVQSRDLLLLEQAEWGTYSGVLTRVNLARYLGAALYNESAEGTVKCGWDGGALGIIVHAYPLTSGLIYRLTATAGEIPVRTLAQINESATLQYTLTQSANLRHPAQVITGARWLTGPYKRGGSRVAPPGLSIDGQDRRIIRILGEPVYGSLALSYTVQRDNAVLKLDAATARACLESGWSEWVIGAPSGGRPVALPLTAPPGAEEQAQYGTQCGRWSLHVHPADSGERPAQPADKHIACNYCELKCEDEA